MLSVGTQVFKSLCSHGNVSANLCAATLAQGLYVSLLATSCHAERLIIEGVERGNHADHGSCVTRQFRRPAARVSWMWVVILSATRAAGFMEVAMQDVGY